MSLVAKAISTERMSAFLASVMKGGVPPYRPSDPTPIDWPA